MDRNALVINCSPVRTGATAEIVKTVSDIAVNMERIPHCVLLCTENVPSVAVQSQHDMVLHNWR